MEDSALAKQIRAWQSGIASERTFWDNWFAAKGGRWPQDFAKRLQADAEIEEWLLGPDPRPDIRILDVGAGPMTILGRYYKGRPLDITACDPLAPIYAQLAIKHGVTPPVVTHAAFAEDLSSFYAVDSFDLVHCRNARDHSFDPVRGVSEMLKVAKLGGRVLLRHFTDEAEHGKYGGFHQWNFTASSGDFIVWNPEARIDVTEQLRSVADTDVRVSGRDIVVTLIKRAPLPSESADALKLRIRNLLNALVAAAV